MISSGRLAKLEGELAMQKNLCEEMKKNQAEMDDFVQARKRFFPHGFAISQLGG